MSMPLPPDPAAAQASAGIAAALAAGARCAACAAIKRRARAYAARPASLEALGPGLSRAGPAVLIATAAALLRQDAAAPARWFGFGGETSVLNACALMLLGRARRRAGG